MESKETPADHIEPIPLKQEFKTSRILYIYTI